MLMKHCLLRSRPTQRSGWLAAALLALTASVWPVSAAEVSGKLETVAPGIWRLRLGQPEPFTPVHFRSAPVAAESLKGLPAAGAPPMAASEIRFQKSARGCTVELPMDNGEGIYGFGLNTELFDMTKSGEGHAGRRVFLKPTDHPENDLGESHAPVPFFVSTRGYGVFVDSARFVSFYTGDLAPVRREGAGGQGGATNSTSALYAARELNKKTILVEVPVAAGVDVYIFAGPQMADAVRRYNLFSGGGCVPPLWGLGVAYRGDTEFSAAESLALAGRMRADHLPCDVWGVEPGWETATYSSSFVWATNRFPDPSGFIASMHQQGFRLNFWQHAFTHPSSPMYAALLPWSGDYQVWGGLAPDFASPEARRIFVKQNEDVLFSKGVDAVKLDECDYQPDSAAPWSFPEISRFPSGLDGEQMHSLYGVLYQQTLWEPYQRRGLRTWGLVRNSQALAAPLPYTIYSDSYDHRCFVRGLVNEGFTGLLWVPEVRHADSVEDLYRRVETVIFSPQALINCWYMKNPPWLQIDRDKSNRGELQPDHEAVTANIRKILELRMAFVPYLYSAFNEYRLTGTPPIRALVMDWPQDPKVRDVDDQYMFGPSVMVAPMFAGQVNRQVYLPVGDWYDFWTGQKLAGGQSITATNDQQHIPLYVKSGSLLPLAEPVEHIGADTCFQVVVRSYGPSPADFVLYEDDGTSDAFATGQQNQLRLHWDAKSRSVVRQGNYSQPPRYRVVDWKANP